MYWSLGKMLYGSYGKCQWENHNIGLGQGIPILEVIYMAFVNNS
jgi:hypothetical protein